MEDIKEEDKFAENPVIERDESGLIQLPEVLKGAPDNIIELYMKWLGMTEVIANEKSRYFNFVSQKTGAVETVDAMNWENRAIQLAKAKGMSDEEVPRLKNLCRKMLDLKLQKGRLNSGWMAWVRPRMGRDVFDWKKAEIMEWYAKYSNHDEVKKNLEAAGYVVSINDVIKFFLNNRDTIDKKRIEFIRSSKDHYLATDAGRMETLAMLHAKFMQLFNDSYATAKPDKNMLKALSQEIRAIVEQARKEIKGEEVKLTVDGHIDINASMQATLTIQDISKKMPIHIIPIYLVAAKMGIDPHSLLGSLTNSFYRKFNGFGVMDKNASVPNTIDIIRNYDWNEISQYHRDKPIGGDATIVDYEDIPFAEANKVQSKREKLQEILKSQRDDLANNKL